MSEAKNKTSGLKWIGGVIFLCLLIFMTWWVWAKGLKTEGGNSQNIPTLSPPISSEIPSQEVEMTTKIVAFGDSITAGFGLTLSEAYPAQLERILAENGYEISLVNSGVSGETSTGGLRRAQFVADQAPDLVLIALGGNDVLRGIDPEVTREALAKTIAIFKNAGAKVLLAGMYAPENLGEDYVAKFNAIYPALAQEFNVPLIPFLLEGVALNPDLNQPDGIHPTEEGAKIIAEQTIYPKLKAMLDEMSPRE